MTNTQDMIAKAKKAIELKKIELSTRLLDCNTSKTVCDFGYKISNFSGLYGCYEAIERIEKRDKEKAFESPEDFNDSIRVIYDKLARI